MTRLVDVRLDDIARRFVSEIAASGSLPMVVHGSGPWDAAKYQDKEREVRCGLHDPDGGPLLFGEVGPPDHAKREGVMGATGVEQHGYRVLKMTSTSVPHAIAALAMHVRDLTGCTPHLYFEWTERRQVFHRLRRSSPRSPRPPRKSSNR